jgi:hypothetical protein
MVTSRPPTLLDDVGFVLSGALKGVEEKRVKTHVVEHMRILLHRVRSEV